MGEKSKRIGEIGENTVADFLTLIGWGDYTKNFDIDCVDKPKHKSKAGTHGIDGYFHYECPMISNTLENVLISSKYSANKYESNIVSTFKKDFNALTQAIECFKVSPIRNEANNSHCNISTVFDRGLLFKINNSDSLDASIINKLCNIEVPKDNNHDGVILVDNDRINFLYNCISFAKNEYKSSDVRFIYFNTGLNNSDQSTKGGYILPFQYLASDIIPFRIQNEDSSVYLLLCYKEAFSEEDFLKLLGIAKNLGANLQQKTIIAFPDYNELNHGHSITKVKQLFKDDKAFSDSIEVISYQPTFRR